MTTHFRGHLAALFTILVWGSTFVSTKLLLDSFTPLEILLFRFLIGFFILLLLCPKLFKIKSLHEEILFAAAGLCGITFYYLLENIALTYTTASNAGVIVSISPFLTAILARIFLQREQPGAFFYLGFVFALSGIFLISFSGNSEWSLSPIGDLLALSASIVWAFYSILSRKIGALGYNTIQTTRRTFFYGIIFMLPALGLMDFQIDAKRLSDPFLLSNLLFLGIGASALCFVTWNLAVRFLGAIKTSVYIYLVPVITVAMSVIILKEPLSWMTILGILLTLTGLFLSEIKAKEAAPTL